MELQEIQDKLNALLTGEKYKKFWTSKMNEFMFRLTGRMGGWLTNKLPRLTDRWWDDLVLNNLSVGKTRRLSMRKTASRRARTSL